MHPALIISPDDLNVALPRVIIALLTSNGQPLGCRPEVIFNRRSSRILLNQIRSVDKRCLLDKLDEIDEDLWHPIFL